VRVGQLGLECSDAAVEESGVGPGGREFFVLLPVVVCKFADPLSEAGVLRGDPFDGLVGQLALGGPLLSDELADAAALHPDFLMGSTESSLGVEGSCPPGGLPFGVAGFCPA